MAIATCSAVSSLDLDDHARLLRAQGRIAYSTAGGLVTYAGRWTGDPDGDWSAQGAAEAEQRVSRWLEGLAEHYPAALRDAAQLVASSTTEGMLRASLSARLKWWGRGISAAGGDGAGARREAEAEAWAAFARRCEELSASAG